MKTKMIGIIVAEAVLMLTTLTIAIITDGKIQIIFGAYTICAFIALVFTVVYACIKWEDWG